MEWNPDKRNKTLAWEKEAWLATVPLLASNQEVDLENIKTFYEWSKARGLFLQTFNYQRLAPFSGDF